MFLLTLLTQIEYTMDCHMMDESLAASSRRAKVSQRLWLTSLSSSYGNLQAK